MNRDRADLVIGVIIALLVGFGFVAPTAGAVLAFVGVSRPVAVLLGVLAGVAVFFYVLATAKQVRRW